MSQPKVAILTNSSAQATALYNAFEADGIEISAFIQTTVKKRPPKTRFKKRLRRLWHYWKHNSTARKALRLEAQSEKAAEAKLSDYINERGLDKRVPSAKKVAVNSINSQAVIALLKEKQIDIAVVWGTGIIKKRVLNRAGKFINAHSSILPYYRGTRSEFWQCYNQEYGHVGVTFHYVDPGVDTGNIIEQVPLHQDVLKEPFNLRVENRITVLQNYPSIIKAIIQSNGIRGQNQKTSEGGRTYRAKDITLEKRIELYQRLLKD